MSFSRTVVLCAIFAVYTAAASVSTDNNQEVQEKKMINCLAEADLQCIKLRALVDVYKLMKSQEVEVMDGVKLEYTGDNKEAVEARVLADQGWGSLFNFVPRLMRSLKLKLNIIPGGYVVISRDQKENGLIDVSVESEREVSEGRK